MSLPAFSVITCTRNSEPWLQESIASVLMQRGVEFELIFVDGGSYDGTLQRIRAIDRPCKLIENVRGGISRAMNAGLEAARGDIIAHLQLQTKKAAEVQARSGHDLTALGPGLVVDRPSGLK